jgi:hypothetical protein
VIGLRCVPDLRKINLSFLDWFLLVGNLNQQATTKRCPSGTGPWVENQVDESEVAESCTWGPQVVAGNKRTENRKQSRCGSACL